MENTSDSLYNTSGNMIDVLYEDYDFELPEPHKTIVLVLHWLIPVMVFASIFGNVLIIVIMCMPSNRDASTSVYFIVLAISDMFLMVFFASARWLSSVTGIIMFGTGRTAARIKLIAENWSVQFSSLILAMITLERVICLIVPHRFKRICNVRVASLVAVLTCVLVLTFHIVSSTVMVDAVYIDNFLVYTERFEGGLSIFSWLDFVFGFLLPFIVIFVGTIVIVYRLFRLRGKDMSNNRTSILQTLVAVNIVFLISMSPFRALYIKYPDAVPTDMTPELFEVIHEFFVSLADLNSTLNFYLYVLSGKRFRADTKRLFCCLVRQHSTVT